MPVNFDPYIPKAMDLLTPAMNMVKLKQDQEQMGLLRDYRTMQMQQMQVEQQKAEQQAKKQSFDEWLNIYDKISPEAAQIYAKNNPQSMSAFQGLDESVLYSNDFQNDLAASTKKVHKLKEVSRDPRTIQEVTTNEYNNLMGKYGGKDKYKEALSQFGKGIPTEEQVTKGEAGNIAESLSMLPGEAKAQYEPLLKPQLMGKSPEIYKQMYPAEGEKKPQTGYFKWLSDKGLQDSPSNERAYLDFVKRERTAKGPAIKVDIGFTKATQTELEKGQMEKEQQIMELDEIDDTYKPEFLTYKGQGIAFAERLGEKAGLGTPTDFLKDRTAWFVQAKSSFLKYRKWVTGVAGGEKEMTDIAKAYPDPERNSPTEFKSNLRQTRKWAKKVLNWTKYTRAKGLSISETPENMTAPKGATPSINLQNFSDAELMEMLEGTQ